MEGVCEGDKILWVGGVAQSGFEGEEVVEQVSRLFSGGGFEEENWLIVLFVG